jgi:hypothetical protein
LGWIPQPMTPPAVDNSEQCRAIRPFLVEPLAGRCKSPFRHFANHSFNQFECHGPGNPARVRFDPSLI